MSVRVPLLSPPPKATNTRLKDVLRAGVERDAQLTTQLKQCVIAKQPEVDVSEETDSSTHFLEKEVYNLGFDIGMPGNNADQPKKRQKTTDGNDPAAAGGGLDDSYQRVQSYYVCAQENEPVLFVVKGWFFGDNRKVYDALQRSAGLGLKLWTNDFYLLDSEVPGRPKVKFEKSLDWYNALATTFNSYFSKMVSNDGTSRESSLTMTERVQFLEVALRVPSENRTALVRHITHENNLGKDGVKIFCAKLDAEFQKIGLPKRNITKFDLYRVPAKPDSMVFFTGPHMVMGTPVRRMVAYVHSLSDVTAREVLDKHGQKYTNSVQSMQIPPNAQGKNRSSLVDKYLKEEYGEWGWGAESIPDDVRVSLLIDKDSINKRDPNVQEPDKDTIKMMRSSMILNSCYVHYNVLGNAKDFNGEKFTGLMLEQHVLQCYATVLDYALREHESLKTQLRDWLEKYQPLNTDDLPLEAWPWTGIDAFLRLPPSGPNPENPTHHRRLLVERIESASKGMTKELQEFAISVCLRGHRKPKSLTWGKYGAPNQEFAWSADPNTDLLKKSKFLRSAQEVAEDLKAAPPRCTPYVHSVADGPLARKDGNMDNEKDLWQLVRNTAGDDNSVRLRYILYKKGDIAHPHIGAWVSPLKPWCPSLSKPIMWQNVYQVLTKGMFDSHYMPQHHILRRALKPLIEQMWHATGRRKFKKILFAPERFNLRELPEGGEALSWHIDQDALGEIDKPLEAPASEINTEPTGSFLSDA